MPAAAGSRRRKPVGPLLPDTRVGLPAIRPSTIASEVWPRPSEVLATRRPPSRWSTCTPGTVSSGPPLAAIGTSVFPHRGPAGWWSGEQQGVARATRAELPEQPGELLGADLQEVGVDVEVDQLDPESGVTEHLAGPGGDLAEVPATAGVGSTMADGARWTRWPTPCRARKPSSPARRGRQDPSTGLVPDPVHPAQSARHRALVHAGFARDIDDGDAPLLLLARRHEPGRRVGGHAWSIGRLSFEGIPPPVGWPLLLTFRRDPGPDAGGSAHR